MKKLFVVFSVVALALCGCGKQTKEEYTKENFYNLFAQYNVIKDGVYIVENNGAYSIINSNTGEIYVDELYTRLEKISDENLLAANKYAYSIISPKGEIIKTLGNYENIRLYKNGDQPRLLTYSKGYYTLLDGNGQLIGDYGMFDHLQLNTKTNDSFVIQRGTLYTVINENGDQIANLGRFEELKPVFENDSYIAMRNGKKGVINNNGVFMIQPSYHDIWAMNKNGYYVLNSGDTFGVANTAGKVIVPVEYSGVEGYKKALIVVKNGKYGAFDLTGKEILPCEYEQPDNVTESETEFKANFVKDKKTYSVTVNADGFTVE